jgi:nitroreductase
MLNDILKRTSCRKYLDKPIEVEKINKLKEIINSSPTALNLQDFSCIFVTDKQTRDKIAIYAGNQRHISEAPLFIAFYGDHNRLKDKAH